MSIHAVTEGQTHCRCGWELPLCPMPVRPSAGEPIRELVVVGVAVVVACPRCECGHVWAGYTAESVQRKRSAAKAAAH